MKLIFLDIDGVLNYGGCKARSATGCLGIEDEKVALLKQIVDRTGAKIVLSSTWKTEWFRTEYIEDLPKDGRYMVKQLAKQGIHILAKTEDSEWSRRGRGILDFINHFPQDVESFVILDDESFDFEFEGIDDKFVHTSFADGLLPEHVERAVSILNDSKS